MWAARAKLTAMMLYAWQSVLIQVITALPKPKEPTRLYFIMPPRFGSGPSLIASHKIEG